MAKFEIWRGNGACTFVARISEPVQHGQPPSRHIVWRNVWWKINALASVSENPVTEFSGPLPAIETHGYEVIERLNTLTGSLRRKMYTLDSYRDAIKREFGQDTRNTIIGHEQYAILSPCEIYNGPVSGTYVFRVTYAPVVGESQRPWREIYWKIDTLAQTHAAQFVQLNNKLQESDIDGLGLMQQCHTRQHEVRDVEYNIARYHELYFDLKSTKVYKETETKLTEKTIALSTRAEDANQKLHVARNAADILRLETCANTIRRRET